MGSTRAVGGVILLAAACGRHPGPPPAPPAAVSASAAPPAAASAAAPVSVAAATPPAPHREPCGALECTQYDSPSDAFRDAIAANPLVVAVGEAHAPKGASAPSAAKRFTQELLPLLGGRASDLLVELMMPPNGCADAATEVREKQAPATSRQAETNQSEYVAMGERARTFGIVPDMLRPTCADLDGVRRAGDDAIGRRAGSTPALSPFESIGRRAGSTPALSPFESIGRRAGSTPALSPFESIAASLELIARLSLTQGKRLVDRDTSSDADRGKMVVLYGGMLHNDLAPAPERARWSYAPDLASHVGGRFVAVDLVVPEFIGDDDTWRSLPWWPHYDRGRLGGKTTLFRTGERSYVIVFPAGV